MSNATVSHELRSPLQAISSQNLKIELCLKELLVLISDNSKKDEGFKKGVGRDLTKMIRQVQGANNLVKSSMKIMGFVVDDLLDLTQLEDKNF